VPPDTRPIVPGQRLANLDILRALAALAVCFHHFNREALTGGTWYAKLSEHGHFGVDVFFVISGYVIPLALVKRSFRVGGIVTFLHARFLRLYPAYALAALLTLGLWYASTWMPGFRGELPPALTWSQFVANATLTCDFFHQEWFGIVFWTLAIEAQYYVLIALCFGVLFGVPRGHESLRLLVLAGWLLLPLYFRGGATVFGWTALFAMGILALQCQQRLISNRLLAGGLMVAFLVQVEARGLVSAGLGLSTALAILFLPDLRMRWLAWVGGISYSLYLLHVPFGGRVMNFLERFAQFEAVRIASVPLALATSVLVAWIFFLCVEKPSHEAARRVSRKGR